MTDVVAEQGARPRDELLRLAGAAEARSGHPLAQAVLDELERRGLANDLPVDDFENLAGHGVSRSGWRSPGAGRHPPPARGAGRRRSTALSEQVERLLAEGKTLMLVAVDGRAAGVVAAADTSARAPRRRSPSCASWASSR